ncbi:PAAR domain-containing protein [Burkholderia sp. BKH01]|nr:PAAR domain-containing protein [Burkholderia sp. BKH01]
MHKGEKLEYGGEVTSGSPWTEFMGRPLARRGDDATCDLHDQTVIDGGADKFPHRDHKLLHGAATRSDAAAATAAPAALRTSRRTRDDTRVPARTAGDSRGWRARRD